MIDEEGKGSATAQLHVKWLMLEVVSMMPLRMGMIHISGAYLQSGPIR